MRLSVIIPVLNSHEVVRRQVLHWGRVGLPEGTEIILVDDGSAPAIQAELPGLRIVRTYDYRPWTWALARNLGARLARGRYLCMVDLDHVLTREAMETCAAFDGDKIKFARDFGVLDEDGVLRTDRETLLAHDLDPTRRRLSPHPNMFSIRADLFRRMGGYREDRVGRPYPQGEDSEFKGRWHRMVERGEVTDGLPRPVLYMFPNGKYCAGGDVDADPHGLFHGLSRKSERNPFHHA